MVILKHFLCQALLMNAEKGTGSQTIRHIHLNNAGASPSPPQVQDAIFQHMQLETEVGAYRAAEIASDKLKCVYESVARLIGSNDRNGLSNEKYRAWDEIALVESATVGWTRAFYSMLETKERELIKLHENEGKQGEQGLIERFILVSEAEYAANLVAAVKFARDRAKISRFRWKILPIPSTVVEMELGGKDISVPSGVVDLDVLRAMLGGKYAMTQQRLLDPKSIAMVCITHIPTNSGIINPVNDIGQIIEDFNCGAKKGRSGSDHELPSILYLVDACQSAGQICIDVGQMKCHALTATGRKYLRGPRGTGFLYVQKDIADLLEPSHVDHSAAPVKKVMPTPDTTIPVWKHGLEEECDFGLSHSYQAGAARFEFWESNLALQLGLGAAIDESLTIGMDKIEKRCMMLSNILRQRLGDVPGVSVYHVGARGAASMPMCGIVTFSVLDLDANTVKRQLEEGVYCELGSQGGGFCKYCFHLSVVPATSTPLDSSRTGLGEEMLLRASISYFNTEDEIDLFLRALGNICCKE